MVFERFRRAGRGPKTLACYGKLPLHAEFLRFGIDSSEASWVVEWVDQAHHLVAAEEDSTDRPAREVQAVVAFDGGRALVAALIRSSTDAKGRRYPICIFASHDGRPLQRAWHLAPLWLAPLWPAMLRTVSDPAIDSRDQLAQVLAAADCGPGDLEGVEQRFTEAMAMAITDPWKALTGAADAEPRARMARRFVQLAEAQGEAREGRGPVIRFPITKIEALNGQSGPAMISAAWLRLMAAASGCTRAWPAVMHQREPAGGDASSICIFGRAPLADDLAHLLSAVGDPPIEDLSEAWDEPPATERGRHTLERLLNPQSGCLADLWGAEA